MTPKSTPIRTRPGTPISSTCHVRFWSPSWSFPFSASRSSLVTGRICQTTAANKGSEYEQDDRGYRGFRHQI